MEVWGRGNGRVDRGVCNKIWKGGGWPEGWKEGAIVPIAKKRNGERVEDYREVTLMPTLYKVYTAILGERLREEIEKKGMIPSNQTGFKKGMGTIDNIYVLNYLVNKKLGTRKGKVIAMFVDLKAAFDSVDRGVLIEAMRKRGIREGLIERIGEVLRETRSRVRVGERMGEGDFGRQEG